MTEPTNTRLPCPFCNATPHKERSKMIEHFSGYRYQLYVLRCPHGHAQVSHETWEGCVEKWNTRAAIQQQLMGDEPLSDVEVGDASLVESSGDVQFVGTAFSSNGESGASQTSPTQSTQPAVTREEVVDKTTYRLLKAAIRAWRVMDVSVCNAPETEELFDALNEFPEAITDEVLADIKKDEERK